MNAKTLFKVLPVFSVCFIGISLLIVHEVITGHLSPRGLGIALAALMLATIVAFIAIVKSVKKNVFSKSPEAAHLLKDQLSKNEPSWMWIARIGIIFLVLLFVYGLFNLREKPLAPRLVGLTINFLITYYLIKALQRVKRGTK